MSSFEKIVTDSKLIIKDGYYQMPNQNLSVSFPKEGYNQLASFEDNSFWFKHRNNVISYFAKKYLNKDHPFLDIGGGNGFVTRRLQDEGFDAILIEPGISGILNAKKRGIKNLINAKVDDLSINHTIVNIGLFDVIEHIENDHDFLKMLYDKVPSGSKVMITVPAFMSLWSKIDEESGHYRRYTKEQLEELIQNAGFNTVHSSYFFAPLYPLMRIFGRKEAKDTKSEHEPGDIISFAIRMILFIELSILKIVKIKTLGTSAILIITKK
jgi:2-polyprenyl-3-methyl-5-hydroxy-6-metoxy-1,4-benzoquinol methylase